MTTEVMVWQVSKDKGLLAIEQNRFEANNLEADLENWLAKNPDILGDDLLVIGRQLLLSNDKFLDLLCLDRLGTFVIVELKRDATPRQAVAQALDYASWLDDAGEQEIADIRNQAEEYLERPIGEAFADRFDTNIPELLGQNHRIILAAPRLDGAAERIINYLATRFAVPINAIFFKYARLSGGEEILVRSVLVPEVIPPNGSGKVRLKVGEVLATAEARNVRPLLEVCRRMNRVWEEEPAGVYGGKSFVYVARVADAANPDALPAGRAVFGIDVSGHQLGAPARQLDVWISVPKLATVTRVGEAAIRNLLEKLTSGDNKRAVAIAVAKPPRWDSWGPGMKAGWTKKTSTGENAWIRFSEPAQAELLVDQLKEWATDASCRIDAERESQRAEATLEL